MPAPEISILILTYNHEEFIESAVESVLEQNLKMPYEVIIGEDNSLDKTAKVLERFKDNSNISIYHTQDDSKKIYINGHMTGRRNLLDCLRRARGKYIAYLDGDDYWINPLKLSKQYALMRKRPQCVLCYHDCFMEFDGARKEYPNFYHSEMKDADLVAQKVIPHSSTIFFKNVGFNNLPEAFYTIPFGDRVLFMYLLRFGGSCFLRDKMSVYRVNQKSMWATKFAGTVYAANAQLDLIEQLPDLLQERFSEFKNEIKRAKYTKMSRLLHAILFERGYLEFIMSYCDMAKHVARLYPQKLPNYFITFLKINASIMKQRLSNNLKF